MLFLFTSAFAEPAPIEIHVSDPAVKEVNLRCPDRQLTAPVYNGVATFQEHLTNCEVEYVLKAGFLEEPGVFTCANGSCVKQGTVHLDVSEAAGRVSIVLTDSSATMLELTCPDGYRSRANVNTNTAVFEGVPNMDCLMFFKGGSPARAKKIRPGVWSCSVIGGTGVCKRR